ncbi:MAG: uracil-DNA glycosylase [Acetobacteraceae bacterium]
MDDLAALRLQIEWGADEALEDAPVDRLAGAGGSVKPLSPARPSAFDATASAQRGAVGEAGPPAAPPATVSPAERALQVASAAATLEELRAAIAAFDGCALRDTASNLVFAEGDPAAALLVVGDPPGAAEDRSGTPFAGPAGAYLDRMLGSISLARGDLLLTPLIPWRPPGDRPPSPAELTICAPFLHRLIALAAPRRLLVMGPLAARALLPPAASRRRPRGSWMDAVIPGTARTVPVLPTFSPAELLRSPKDRRAAWSDLRLLRRTLDADAASG